MFVKVDIKQNKLITDCDSHGNASDKKEKEHCGNDRVKISKFDTAHLCCIVVMIDWV